MAKLNLSINHPSRDEIDSEKDSSKFSPLGVKVSFLRTFAESITVTGSEPDNSGESDSTEVDVNQFTVSDVVEKLIRPFTDEYKCSLCDLLHFGGYSDSVGNATIFVTHMWRYKFVDVVKALETHFQDSLETVVWIDAFSKNMHVQSEAVDSLTTSLTEFIHGMDQTIVILPSWSQLPLFTQRAWCMFELYCAGSKVEVIGFDPLQALDSVLESPCEDGNAVKGYLSKLIDIANSQTALVIHKDMILTSIEGQGVSVADANKRIVESLSLSITTSIVARLNLSVQLVKEAYSNGQFELAFALDELFRQFKMLVGDEHPDSLQVMLALTRFYVDMMMFDVAIPLLRFCLDRLRIIKGNDHEDTLVAMYYLAYAYAESPSGDEADLTKITAAISLLQEFIRMKKSQREHTDGPVSIDAVIAMFDLSVLYKKHPESGDANAQLEECQTESAKLYGDEEPTVALKHMPFVGAFYQRNGQEANCMPIFEECVSRSRDILGTRHAFTRRVMRQLAQLCEEALDEKDMAFTMYKRVYTICKELIDQETDSSNHERRNSLIIEIIPLLNKICQLSTDTNDISSIEWYEENLKFHLEEKTLEDNGEHGIDTLITMATLSGLLNIETKRYEHDVIKKHEIEERSLGLLEDAHRFGKEYYPNHSFTVVSGEDLAIQYDQRYFPHDQSKALKAIPLMEEVVVWKKKQFGETHPNTIKAIETLASLYSKHQQLPKSLSLYQECLMKYITIYGESHPEALRVMNSLVSVYFRLGEFIEAIPLCEIYYQHMNMIHGKNHVKTISSLNQLAFAYGHHPNTDSDDNSKGIEKAIILTEQCVECCKELQSQSDTDSNMIQALYQEVTNSLAKLYINAKKYEQAVTLLEDCLAKLGRDDERIIVTMQWLAEAYSHIPEKHDRVQTMWEDCLSTSKRLLGDNSAMTMAINNDLAQYYAQQGKYELSFELFEQCLYGMKERLGIDNPETLRTMTILANLYDSRVLYDKAIELLEFALPKQVELLGMEHIDTLTSLHSLAVVYGHCGQFEKALMFGQNCMMKRIEILGDSHKDTLASMSNVGSLLVYLCHYDAAVSVLEAFLSKANTEQDGLIYDNIPDLILAMTNVAIAYGGLKKYEEAIAWHKQSIALNRALLRESGPKIWSSMQEIGKLYIASQRYDDAVNMFEECWKEQKDQLGENDVETLKSLYFTGLAYYRSGKLELALPSCQDCHEKRLQVLGEDHPDTLKVAGLVQQLLMELENAK